MSDFKKNTQAALFAAVTLVAAVLDQLSKRWALANLGDHEPVPLIPGVLEFLRIENRGAAFGILQGLVTLAFLLAGAAGNLIDRAFRQSVVDFIYFKPIDFPVFNVADIYVTCSTFALVLLILRFYEDEDFAFLSRKKEAASQEAGKEEQPEDKEDKKEEHAE